MQEAFYRAKYIVALATNSITDEIRQNFLMAAKIQTEEQAQTLFAKVVLSISKIQTLTVDNQKSIITSEFEALNLAHYLGEYRIYQNCIEGLLDIQATTYTYADWLPLLHRTFELETNLPLPYQLSISNAILDNLIRRDLLLKDVDFASTILESIEKLKATTQNADFNILVSEIVSNK